MILILTPAEVYRRSDLKDYYARLGEARDVAQAAAERLERAQASSAAAARASEALMDIDPEYADAQAAQAELWKATAADREAAVESAKAELRAAHCANAFAGVYEGGASLDASRDEMSLFTAQESLASAKASSHKWGLRESIEASERCVKECQEDWDATKAFHAKMKLQLERARGWLAHAERELVRLNVDFHVEPHSVKLEEN